MIWPNGNHASFLDLAQLGSTLPQLQTQMLVARPMIFKSENFFGTFKVDLCRVPGVSIYRTSTDIGTGVL